MIRYKKIYYFLFKSFRKLNEIIENIFKNVYKEYNDKTK